MMYCGMITTWKGSRRVAIIMPKKMLRPGNLILANAYAETDAERMVPTTAPMARIRELVKNCRVVTPPIPSMAVMKLSKLKLLDHSEVFVPPISEFGLKD